MTVITEVFVTFHDVWSPIYLLFKSIQRIRDSLIQKSVDYVFIFWQFCWRSISLWCGFADRGVVLQEYKHLPLLADRNIRLFQLYRWLPFLGVRGTLREFSLGCIPSYEAISYHWGTVSVTRMIYIDGTAFTVSEATYGALHDRSSLWRTRFVWIDYVCIDQANLSEKSRQISLMKDIYRLASRVIVWLGTTSNNLDVFSVVGLLHDLIRLTKNPAISAKDLCEMVKDSRFSPRWPALVSLLNKPWFARVWVIQEVAVATKVEAVYCSHNFDWAMLNVVIKMFDRKETADFLVTTLAGQDATENVRHLIAMIYLRKAVLEHAVARMGKRFSLGHLLAEFRGFQATDSKDKVFAFLGLSADESQKNLTPNYSKSLSTQDVYLDAARFIVAGNDPFCVFPFAGIGHENRMAHLPS